MGEVPTIKPTAPINWATDDPVTTRIDPGVAKRGEGFVANDIPLNQWANWFQGVAGDYLAWLAANTMRAFDDIAEAVNANPQPSDPAPVETGEFFRYLRLAGPGSFIDGLGAVALQGVEEAARVEHDGSRFLAFDANAQTVRAYPNNISTLLAPPYAAEWVRALGFPGTALSFDTDGALVALGVSTPGGEVFIIDANTGSVLFSLVTGRDVADVFCDSNRGTRKVFFASGADIFLWEDGVGSTPWAARPGPVLALTATADRLVWAEADPINPTGVTIFSAAKNATLTTVPVAIATNPVAIAAGGVVRLVTDSENVYAFWGAVSPAFRPWVSRLPLAGPLTFIVGGNPFWTVELENVYTPPTLRASIAVDDRYVYAVGDTEVYVLEKNTAGVVWKHEGVQAGNVSTEGVNLWLSDRITPTQFLAGSTGRGTSLWRRVSNGTITSDGGSYRRPFRKAAIPITK